MEPLHIAGTRSTPEVRFDPAAGRLELAGESYPENSYEFFRPVLSWLTRFIASGDGPVVLDVRLSYLNTGSTKCMMDILDLLEESFLAGRRVAVDWYCDPENDRAVETAEEFREEVTLPFRLLPERESP